MMRIRVGICLGLWALALALCAAPRFSVATPDALAFRGVSFVPLTPLVELWGLTVSVTPEHGRTLHIARGARQLTINRRTGVVAWAGQTWRSALRPFTRVAVDYVPLRPLVIALGGQLTQASSTLTVTLPGAPTAWHVPLKSQPGLPSAYRDASIELYLVQRDGTGRRRLTYDTVDDTLPAFSPDGAWWVSARAGALLLRQPAQPAGREFPLARYRQMPTPDTWSPSFSADGQQLLFSCQGQICLLDLATDRLRVLADGVYPCFRPGAQQVAYTARNADGSNAVMLLDLPQGTPQRLATGCRPAFSPDGQTLYFRRDEEYPGARDRGTLFRLSCAAPGGVARAVPVLAQAAALETQVSADGQLIVFGRDGARPGIYLAHGDGTAVRRVTTHANDGIPYLSPDSRHIAFHRGNSLWIMRADGSGQHRLAPAASTTYYMGPAVFIPASTAVLYLDRPQTPLQDLGL
ncbi:MAG TPA: hypothetical protein VGL77_17610 [Armatimonadota bacterium]|jgi:hypothetical protein